MLARLYGIEKDFWRVPNGVFDQLIPALDLDPYPGYLFLFLWRQIVGHQAYDRGTALRLKDMARDLRMSVPTVRRSLATLEEKGLIEVVRDRRGEGKGFPLLLTIRVMPPSQWPIAVAEGERL